MSGYSPQEGGGLRFPSPVAIYRWGTVRTSDKMNQKTATCFWLSLAREDNGLSKALGSVLLTAFTDRELNSEHRELRPG